MTGFPARKPFVPRRDGSDPIPGQLFARLTRRAGNVLAAAQDIAGPADVPAAAIVVGLLNEPEGLATVILHQLGASGDAVTAAFGLRLADARPDARRRISFADDAAELLRGTRKAVLRLGHDYVGTEHLLLGALLADGTAAATLKRLGVTADAVERAIGIETARLRDELDRTRGGQG